MSNEATNTTTENLTVHFTQFDADVDSVVNITDWKINGTSIAVLNMPFENHSNAANNATDYSIFENNGTRRRLAHENKMPIRRLGKPAPGTICHYCQIP